jgi:hypothetical protein
LHSATYIPCHIYIQHITYHKLAAGTQRTQAAQATSCRSKLGSPLLGVKSNPAATKQLTHICTARYKFHAIFIYSTSYHKLAAGTQRTQAAQATELPKQTRCPAARRFIQPSGQQATHTMCAARNTSHVIYISNTC